MRYAATIEAPAYAEAEEDGKTLLGVLPGAEEDDPGAELVSTVGVDEGNRMLRTALVFDADDAVDAHEQAMEVWVRAWEEAFPGLALPAVVAVRAEPAASQAEAPASEAEAVAP